MIYALAQDVAARLVLRKFPVRVVYGPERLARDCPSTAAITIVIERDRTRGDAVRAAPTTRTNPRLLRVRDIGCAATVFARSSLPGAQVHEHEHDCDQVVDALLIALVEWGVENQAGTGEISGGRFLSPSEVAGAEHLSGVVYQLQFRVPRGLLVRDYEGAAQPTGTLDGITTALRVSLDGVSYEAVPPLPLEVPGD
jgi:hypothetical protein